MSAPRYLIDAAYGQLIRCGNDERGAQKALARKDLLKLLFQDTCKAGPGRGRCN